MSSAAVVISALRFKVLSVETTDLSKEFPGFTALFVKKCFYTLARLQIRRSNKDNLEIFIQISS